MSKNISIAYQLDGSVICNGGVDPNRTATYAGPKNSAGQLANVAAFYALEPDIPNAMTSAPVMGTVTTIFSLIGANMNTTADQAFAPSFVFSRFMVTSVIAMNASTSLTLAAGGIYTGTSKGGSAIVGASQVYSGLTGPTQVINPVLGVAGQTLFNSSAANLSLTVPQGSAATANFYIMGIAG